MTGLGLLAGALAIVGGTFLLLQLYGIACRAVNLFNFQEKWLYSNGNIKPFEFKKGLDLASEYQITNLQAQVDRQNVELNILQNRLNLRIEDLNSQLKSVNGLVYELTMNQKKVKNVRRK